VLRDRMGSNRHILFYSTVTNVTSNTIYYVPTRTALVENDFWKRPLNGRKTECGTKCIKAYINSIIKINYIRQHCLFLFIHKATCFDPSVGHLQAYIAG